jgi:hypothetical protein
MKMINIIKNRVKTFPQKKNPSKNIAVQLLRMTGNVHVN